MFRFLLLSTLTSFVVAYALTGALQPALAAAAAQGILLRIALAIHAGAPALRKLVPPARAAAPHRLAYR